MRKALAHILMAVGLVIGAQSANGAAAAAVVVELRGTVRFSKTGADAWQDARIGDPLQVGDTIQTGEDSWVALRFGDRTMVRKGPLTTVTIRPPAQGTRPELDVKGGLLYFFGRDRTDTLRIRTPSAAGAIRGTEFNVLVAENGAAKITMIEGEVAFDGNEVRLQSGMEAAVAQSGEVSSRTVTPGETREVIQWSFYYPAILDLSDLDLDSADLAKSVAAYREGDLRAALVEWPRDRVAKTEDERVYLAAVLLANGSFARAIRELEFAEAPALRELIAAMKLQPQSAASKPKSATEHLAASYTAQARENLESALNHARAATEASPKFAFAWARVAELEFSFGHANRARDALNHALELAPKYAPAHALRGFISAARLEWADAEKAFDEAIRLDGGIGNAWLGRGLVTMRRGRVHEGMQDLHTAALMEPPRGILRAYLGKAHFENRDTANALRELDLAFQFAPQDPTAWLYRAILLAQKNRINEGIDNLETSQRLNDNRALFRSRHLLDQDQAVRAANLAAMYRDAGLREVSVREAARAVNYDYANSSAHLFLANSYDALRDPNQVNLRYETAWQSEWLLANLLAPVGAGTLSQTVSQQEYSRMFARDGLRFRSGTRYLSSGEWRQYGSQYGTFDGFGYALDAVYLSEKGDAPNTDVEHLTLYGAFKLQITAKDSLFGQVVYYRNDSGDVRQYYNPTNASRSLSFEERQEPTVFAGYHRAWSPEHNTLFLAARLNDEIRFADTNSIVPVFIRGATNDVTLGRNIDRFAQRYSSQTEIWSAEAQHIWSPGDHQFIAGARGQIGELETVSSIQRPGNIFPVLRTIDQRQSAGADFDRVSAYGYWYWQVFEPVQVIGGLSYDRLRFPVNMDFPPLAVGEREEEKVSPKAGFVLNPLPDTWVRGAYTRSLGGLYLDTSARLEPAQVAGLIQGFRSAVPESESGAFAGSEFESIALGADHRFPTRTYVGVDAELLRAEGDRSIGVFNAPPLPPRVGQARQEMDFRERTLLLTAHQLMGDQFALGVTYRISRAELKTVMPGISRAAYPTALVDVEATLQETRLQFFWNHPLGLFGQAEGVRLDQENIGYGAARPDNASWRADFWLGYRLARRRAEFRVGLLNATDEDYRLNPLNLYAPPVRERTLALELKLDF